MDGHFHYSFITHQSHVTLFVAPKSNIEPLAICLSVCLFVRQFVRQFVRLFVRQFVCLLLASCCHILMLIRHCILAASPTNDNVTTLIEWVSQWVRIASVVLVRCSFLEDAMFEYVRECSSVFNVSDQWPVETTKRKHELSCCKLPAITHDGEQ